MGLWAESIVIFNSLREHGKQSIRSLADRTGLSKSSVHSHLQAMDHRDRSPESSFWETKAGRTRLIRLVVAPLFVFGLKRSVGAETLSEFFGRLHLDSHVGCPPSALRHVMHMLECLLLEAAAAWEKEGITHGEIRPVIGAVDETFLQPMMLMFMDLATGYLLMEEVATDRCFGTWYDRANDRLTTFGTEVLYVVSDRAKALVKLAHTGLGCLSIPDLFHLSQGVAKGSALAIFGRLWQAKRDLEQATQRLEMVQKKEVEEQLRAELGASETLLETDGLPMKKNTLDKVRKQLASISALVDFWWQTVHQDLAQMAMTPKWTQWAELTQRASHAPKQAMHPVELYGCAGARIAARCSLGRAAHAPP
jgi:hypothetical protein